MWVLKNIYDPAPIPPNEDGARLFIGRAEERRTLSRVLSIGGGSRVTVESEYGMGKTSFINIGKYDKHGELLAPELEIDVERGWTSHEFMWYLLSAVLAKISADHPKDFKRDGVFKKALVTVEETKSMAISGGLAGLVTGEKGRAETVKGEMFPSFHFRKYLNEISERVTKRLGYAGIVAHLNNLDRLSGEELKIFIMDIHDIMLTPNYHFILAAKTGTQSYIQRTTPMAHIFTSLPITLKPLSKREVQEAIERRMRALGVEEPPVDWEVVNYLYEISKGEIRYVFEMCNTLVAESHRLPVRGSIKLDYAEPFLKKLAFEEVKRANMRKSQLEKLIRIAEKELMSPSECARVIGVGEKNLTNVLRPLEERGLVRRTTAGICAHTDVKLALDLLKGV